jgi:hypothetical protein
MVRIGFYTPDAQLMLRLWRWWLSMGRSCGHCCGCCDCIEVLESFSLKLGEYKYFDSKYFLTDIELDDNGDPIIDADTGLPKRKPRCKATKVMNGYSVSTECSEDELSDKVVSCRGNCSRSERYWYIIDEDNCKIYMTGQISCDGAFLDFDDRFRYAVIQNNITAGVFEEPVQIVPADCDLYANFQLVTCCSDPTKKSSFPDDSLCQASIAKPICESCGGSSLPLATKMLVNVNYDSPNQFPMARATWDLCPYFNVVGMADKLYKTYSFSYDGKCPVSCNDTNQMMLASRNSTLTPQIFNNPDGSVTSYGEPYTRNYRRFWAIHEYPIISPQPNECCGVIIKGEIDEHGRLLPPISGVNVPEWPDTCNYCIDGSWHCDPRITIRLAGLINNDNTAVMDITSIIKVSDIVSTEGLDPNLNFDIPIFCCGRRGNIASLRNFFRSAPIYVWKPFFLPAEEGEDPADLGARKIEYRLAPAERDDDLYLQIILNYKTESGPEPYLDTSLAVAAYFEMKLIIHTNGYVEELTLQSQRICPTTDGKIDCNILNGVDGIIFDKIVSSGFSLLSLDGSPRVVNRDEIQPIVSSSLTVIKKADTRNLLQSHCITKDTLKALPSGDCGFKLIWNGTHKSTIDPIFQNNRDVKTFALSICCCDTNHVVKLNRDLPEELREEIGCGGLTPTCEERTEAGIRCRCTQFDPVIMCSFSRESELGVIIIDESSPDYTMSCNCPENFVFNADLALFREKAPDTDIVLLQPVHNYGEYCDSETLSWLCGGCPLPEEVIDYRNNIPRRDKDGTFELLKAIFYLHVQGGLNGTGSLRYSAMNIYRDVSGSVTDIDFAEGTALFIAWATEFFPEFPVQDIKFGNERWLRYAADNKGGVKCYAKYTGPGCNSNVYINQPPRTPAPIEESI